MAYAYSPGLKVLETTTLRRHRRLPLAGDILVKVGDSVYAEDVVMKTELPGKADIVNLVGMLGCFPSDVPKYTVKKPGDSIKIKELLAQSTSFFGLFKTNVYSPMTGTIETISPLTGQVTLRGTPVPIEVKAYVTGKIVDLNGTDSVTVETTGTFAQGIFGVGGETEGDLVFAVDEPKVVLSPDAITDDFKGKIVVAGAIATYDLLQKAIACGVNALIVGGFDDADLKQFLGYDLGVAITGHENMGITLIITEGFGEIPIAEKTFQILKKCEGKHASVNGATQIRAGVMRPEIIVPHDEVGSAKDESETKLFLDIGTRVRVIREPYFGLFGAITELPVELTKLATESEARVLKLKFDDGHQDIIPRANVEVIATDI